MKKQIYFLCMLALAACLMTGCSVTFPESGFAISGEKAGGEIIVHTGLNTYKFYSFTIHDSLLTGLSQVFKKTESPIAPLEIDSRYPPVNRTIGLRDILRVDAPEHRIEPIVDTFLYGVVPITAILILLVPIAIHGKP
ncbi:MAG TPA: hypothetical protein VFJ29_04490 [Candidatus Kapabacteria bacterium]|nr:hypothetical protein [Candidatus Kapabacteria bacterium]